MQYKQRTLSIIVMPVGEAIYADSATIVSIEDEAGGEFVLISQDAGDYGKIAVNSEEWPVLRDAIDKMIAECRS